MPRPTAPPPPSYYQFIPVDGTRRVAVSNRLFTPRSQLDHVAILDLTLIADTPIHIGSGEKTGMQGSGQFQPRRLALRSAAGALYIPGSTLKGVVATNYLALSGSIEETSECFGTAVTGRQDARGPLLSKILFADALPDRPPEPHCERVDESWSPSRRKPHNIKMYVGRAPFTTLAGEVECIPQGTRLRTQIVGIGLRDYELGGLLMALGIASKPDSQTRKLAVESFKVGYGKAKGLGCVRVHFPESLIEEKRVVGLSITSQKHPLASSVTYRAIEAFLQKRGAQRNVRDIWQQMFAAPQPAALR